MDVDESNPDTVPLPSEDELLHRGMVAKTGYFFPNAEASAGARRQRKFRDEKLKEGLRPVNIYAPPTDRARKAVREMALKMKDAAYVQAAETLANEPAAVEILTGPVMKIARAFVEPANDNISEVAQRALADPILGEHLAAFSELDEPIRAAILTSFGAESGLLLRAAQRCLSDATFRKAVANLIADEGLADQIVAHGAEASHLLAVASSDAVKELATRAVEEPGLAEEVSEFISRGVKIRSQLLLLAGSAPDLVEAIAVREDLWNRLLEILPSPEKTRLLEAVARAQGDGLILLNEIVEVCASPRDTEVALALMKRSPLERGALVLLDAAAVVRCFIQGVRQDRVPLEEARKYNAILRFLAQLRPNQVDAILGAEDEIRALATDEELMALLQVLARDEPTRITVALTVGAMGESMRLKERVAAAARILFGNSRRR
jgi:hypothetical protein